MISFRIGSCRAGRRGRALGEAAGAARFRERGQQIARVLVPRCDEHFRAGAGFDDARGEHHGQLRIICRATKGVDVVRGHQDNTALTCRQLGKQRNGFTRAPLVQRGRRLIRDHHRRVTSDCRSDRGPLQHPARQLVRVFPECLGFEPDEIEQFPRAALAA